MKKILILYASYGGGHFSAAKSLKQYLDENHPEIQTDIVDCMKYINKGIEKITTDAYKEMTKNVPWAWKKVYYHSEKGALSKISNTSNKIMAKKLCDLFNKYQPDLVISTHPFSSQMTGYLKRKKKINCKLATILTDFAPHDQWLEENEYCNYYFVSHEGMKKSLINDFKIPEEKIYVTGVPLSKKFTQQIDKNEIYKEFDLTPNKKTILFFGGGEFGLGKSRTVDILKSLTNYLDKYQIVAISGKNPKMNQAFHEIANELQDSSSLKIYDFINKVPEIMSISSLVITKPGGLTISESLASGLPILIINPIPGQEEENAEFLEKSGAAIWLRKKDHIDTIISAILNSDDLQEKMRIASKKLAHVNSTKNICEILIEKIP